MANPQLEDGHTRIANELLEHLMRLYLAPNQWQVLLCIIRKTYGFQKKADFIANRQIVEDTGLVKSTISRALKRLELRNIVIRRGKYIGIQKDWSLWRELAEQSTNEKLAEQSTLVSKLAEQSTNEKLADRQPKLADRKPLLAEQSTKVSSPRVTQKKKETIQKKLYKRKYGEFNNVLLYDLEYQKLKERFNSRLPVMIESLSEGIASKGYKYQSHYATILSWERREKKGGQDGAHRRNPRSVPKPGEYTPPEQI